MAEKMPAWTGSLEGYEERKNGSRKRYTTQAAIAIPGNSRDGRRRRLDQNHPAAMMPSGRISPATIRRTNWKPDASAKSWKMFPEAPSTPIALAYSM